MAQPTLRQSLVYLQVAEEQVRELHRIAEGMARDGTLTVSVAEAIDAQAQEVYAAELSTYEFIQGFVQGMTGLPGDFVVPAPTPPTSLVPLAQDVEATGAKAAVLALPPVWAAVIILGLLAIITVSVAWTFGALRDIYAIAQDTVRFKICLLHVAKAAKKEGVSVTADHIRNCSLATQDMSSAPEKPKAVNWTGIAMAGVAGLAGLGGFAIFLNHLDKRRTRFGYRLEPYNKRGR